MKKNICIVVVCGGLYWLNRLWLRRVTTGLLQWFLCCYFNDVLAGIALLAVTSLLLIAVKRKPLQKLWSMALILLGAGLIWECFAPFWKSGAVFDWWDFAAYLVGGFLYWGLTKTRQRS